MLLCKMYEEMKGNKKYDQAHFYVLLTNSLNYVINSR